MVERSNDTLINNLVDNDLDYFMTCMSPDTKENLFKDGLICSVHKIVEKLNDKYMDVVFSAKWVRGNPSEYMKDDQYHVSKFENDFCSDDHDFFGDEPGDGIVYEIPIENIFLKLSYVHVQMCSLGHTHKKRRLYYYSIPKIVEFISFYKIASDKMEEFVNRYVPNFFF